MPRLLTSILMPDEASFNAKTIARGERRKMLAEEPWWDWCSWPLPCQCGECLRRITTPPLEKPLDGNE